MKETYIKFKTDYHHGVQRQKGDVVLVRVPDPQLQAWYDANVAEEASEAEAKKAAEADARRTATAQSKQEEKK